MIKKGVIKIAGLGLLPGLRPLGTNTNFSNVTVGQMDFKPGPFGLKLPSIALKGYGVDLDGDGKFRGDRDGVLAFDLNKDGRIDQKEIVESRRRLNLMAGNDPDLKNPCKRHKADAERKRLLAQYDSDGDGKLNDYEISAGGGKVLVDTNRDGDFTNDGAHDVRNIRTAAGRFSLDEVDPRGHYNRVRSLGNYGWSGGFSDWGQWDGWGRWGHCC